MKFLFSQFFIAIILFLAITSQAQAYFNYPQINPVAFTIFGFGIKWYGLFYLFGLLGAMLINALLLTADHKNSSYYNKNISITDFNDIAINTFLAAVIGGRIGYVLFYNLPFYIHHPLEIFAVHNGGMSFHGGFLGAFLAIYLQTRKHKNFWQIADLGATVIPFALGIGRIANFINDELWGRTTNVAWAVKFPTGGFLPRHPSQLYEASLEGLVLLIILVLVRLKRINRPGLLAGIFVTGYGISRFIVEFFREPDQQIGYIFKYFTEGQLLSLPMIIFGIWIIYSSKHRKYNYQDFANNN